MIAGIVCLIGGLILLAIPEVRVRSGLWKYRTRQLYRSPATLPRGSAYRLRGPAKNSVAGLFLVVGALSLILSLEPPIVIVAALVIWFVALLLGEEVQPPAPAPAPRLAPSHAARTPPTMLTLALRRHLERVSVTGEVTYDIRFSTDKEGLQACRDLSRLGYLSFTETGPGGSVEIYRLTDKGRAALESPA